MRDNLPNMLRAAAKEWREENKVVATGATRYDAALEEAADTIEELSKLVDESIPKDDAEIIIAEVAKPRWIPVTERLPECDLGAEVGNIEWISCGMVYAGCFGRGGEYRDAYFRTWTDAGEGMDAKDADYWRAVTIPDPPKEEH